MPSVTPQPPTPFYTPVSIERLRELCPIRHVMLRHEAPPPFVSFSGGQTANTLLLESKFRGLKPKGTGLTSLSLLA